ncbi:MAG: transcription elongation factor GreA [Oscillospiraceae bacterium]|nr:transcription elongation factor GreA [Oscillospiraceae bacterium]
MAKTYKLTAKRLEELRAELDYLKNVREKEVAELIKEARSFGDLSENSEYDEAKNEQGKLFSRKAEIENILANAEIIEFSEDTDEVRTGSRVKVCDVSDDSEEEYWIVGSQEADPYKGRISDESPFGRALIGSKLGDIVGVEAPCGVIEYKIVEIGN